MKKLLLSMSLLVGGCGVVSQISGAGKCPTTPFKVDASKIKDAKIKKLVLQLQAVAGALPLISATGVTVPDEAAGALNAGIYLLTLNQQAQDLVDKMETSLKDLQSSQVNKNPAQALLSINEAMRQVVVFIDGVKNNAVCPLDKTGKIYNPVNALSDKVKEISTKLNLVATVVQSLEAIKAAQHDAGAATASEEAKE